MWASLAQALPVLLNWFIRRRAQALHPTHCSTLASQGNPRAELHCMLLRPLHDYRAYWAAPTHRRHKARLLYKMSESI